MPWLRVLRGQAFAAPRWLCRCCEMEDMMVEHAVLIESEAHYRCRLRTIGYHQRFHAGVSYSKVAVSMLRLGRGDGRTRSRDGRMSGLVPVSPNLTFVGGRYRTTVGFMYGMRLLRDEAFATDR